MSKVEEYFNKKGIDTNDIVCYSTTDGTAEPIDFCPMKFAEAYHQSELKKRVKAISDEFKKILEDESDLKDRVKVLCYFENICRVGHWDEEVQRWVIHSDGKKRYYKFIDKHLPIPN